MVRHGVFRIGRHWFSSSSMRPSPMTSTPAGMVVPARFADGMMMRRISSLRTAYAARSVLGRHPPMGGRRPVARSVVEVEPPDLPAGVPFEFVQHRCCGGAVPQSAVVPAFLADDAETAYGGSCQSVLAVVPVGQFTACDSLQGVDSLPFSDFVIVVETVLVERGHGVSVLVEVEPAIFARTP